MATFEITGPDGRKYRVTGDTAEGAFQALRQHVGGAPKVDPATNQPAGVPEYSPPGVEGYNPQTGEVERQPRSKLASAGHGFADVAGFGFADELASYAGSALTGQDREKVLAEMRQLQNEAKADNPKSYLAGQVGGGLVQGVTLAGGGLSMATNAARAGQGLGRVALGSAIDGAAVGAIHGAGSGEDLDERAYNAGLGGAVGGAAGIVAPYAIAGLQAAARPVVAPIMSRIRPDAYANRALGQGLERAGMTADDVAAALSRAQADDQGVYMAADAMGHSGQRMLSTVARNPNNMRQTVVDTLVDRQMGQGDRLSQFLADGFDAADTSAQRQAALTAARGATADANYAVARQGARPVNLNSAIEEIDNLLRRDPILGDTALSTGPLGTRLTRLRDQLQRGGEQLVDFDTVLNIKSDLNQQMKRNPQVASDMRRVYSLLDEALEGASEGYRLANDTFRQQSRVIDAVDTGRGAASPRVRFADSVEQFNSMTPEQQAAFRAGYVDPLITKVEASSISPTTNKARPLMSPKTAEEFPAFAAPGRADQLGNRIAREQRMFETANAALGGTKTADNLADAADAAQFDPEILAGLLSGTPIRSVLSSVGRKIANEAGGRSPRVIERMAEALLETDPTIARELLGRGAENVSQSQYRRALISALLSGGAGMAGGRLSAP